MNIDHFFTIGSAHQTEGTPCEDYALSGRLETGTVFGVVADGCSGAKANTDVGARAIAWAFKRALEQRADSPGEWFGPGFYELLKETFVSFQFAGAPLDYLATLVGIAATPEQASILVHGDGAVVLRYADDRIRVIEFNWWDNTPFYLNYQVHPEWLDKFLRPYQNGVIEPFSLRDTLWSRTEEGFKVDETTQTRFAIDDVLSGHVLNFRPAEQGIVAIAVLTDGLEQFSLPATAQTPASMQDMVPVVEVAGQALAYKNHEGAFVKRRMLRALKEYRKSGVVPRDDVGIATVWFGGKE